MSNKVIYLDVETSGIDPQKHAIVQVAWITEVDRTTDGRGESPCSTSVGSRR
jgi:DNA polymerase III epsilon subunit-like protein